MAALLSVASLLQILSRVISSGGLMQCQFTDHPSGNVYTCICRHLGETIEEAAGNVAFTLQEMPFDLQQSSPYECPIFHISAQKSVLKWVLACMLHLPVPLGKGSFPSIHDRCVILGKYHLS